MGSEIIINNTDVRIRPSAIDLFYNCSYQWGKVFLEGVVTIPNARAAIGTSIHAAVETMWQESMKTGKKQVNLGAMTDAAMTAWKEEEQKDIRFDDGENSNTAAVEIIKGTEAFIEDILPFVEIPDEVESFYSIGVTNPIVKEIGGTVDYFRGKTLADIKTSKRALTASGYSVQQSTYKLLLEANGKPVEHAMIQGVVLKKQPEGMILDMPLNVPQAKHLINGMLATMEVIASDRQPVSTILRGNPKYYLCSNKYCSLHSTCPFVNGEAV
jgi:hypothetical protein